VVYYYIVRALAIVIIIIIIIITGAFEYLTETGFEDKNSAGGTTGRCGGVRGDNCRRSFGPLSGDGERSERRVPYPRKTYGRTCEASVRS